MKLRFKEDCTIVTGKNKNDIIDLPVEVVDELKSCDDCFHNTHDATGYEFCKECKGKSNFTSDTNPPLQAADLLPLLKAMIKHIDLNTLDGADTLYSELAKLEERK